MAIFESRAVVLKADIKPGCVTDVQSQEPEKDKFYDLDLGDLRDQARGDLRRLRGEHNEMLRAQFPKARGWFWGTKAREIRKLSEDEGPQGQRFKEAVWANSARNMRMLLNEMIIDPSQSLPPPHALFGKLLLLGKVRLPPEDLLSLEEVRKTKDPLKIIKLARKIWAYTGFEGLAGDRAYRDVEDPADATASKYHGNDSREGIDLRTRVAWSSIYKTALVAKTPIVLSNMEAASDVESCRIAMAAGITPFLYSSTPDERRKCARELGKNVFITVRTSEKEIKLAKELIDLGANVHIELANAFNPRGIAAVLELKEYIRNKKFAEPRFVSIGKGVGGAYLLACLFADADVVVSNRGGSAICSTPEVSGRGVRTYSASYEESLAQRLGYLLTGYDIPMIADAGIKSGADISRVATVGSESGMIGTVAVRTIDSPPEKVEWKGEIYTRNWGDASKRANKDKTTAVAPQGIEGWFRVPKNDKGEPKTLADLAGEFSKHIQASVADAGLLDSFFQVPILDDSLEIRVPGQAAFLEASARTGTQPDLAEAKVVRESRI